MPLLDSLFGSAAMGEVFSDAARLQHMLDFEAALARARLTQSQPSGRLAAS